MSAVEDGWWRWTRKGWRLCRVKRTDDVPYFFADDEGAEAFEGVIREKQPRGWSVVCAAKNRSTLQLVVRGVDGRPPAPLTMEKIFEYCDLDVEKMRQEYGIVFKSFS